MINYLRDEIITLNSYEVPENPNATKLDAMELPFGVDNNLKSELGNILNNVEINRYPNNHNKLKKVIKNLMDIPDNLDVMFGNGSDELIQIIMLGLKKNTKVLSFNPSFVMYEMIAKWCNLSFKSINLDDNFDIDIDNTMGEINKAPSIIFIAYPNNPTGNCFSADKIKQILNTNALVIIDEAYYAYNNKSFINEINNYDNLIVLRTISKIGFAGLRLGVMICKKEVINEFNKLRMPYNINSLTLSTAEFLLTKKDIILKNTKIIKNNREKLLDTLSNIKEIKAYLSEANFILFSCKDVDGLYNFLLKNNILVKNLTKNIPNSLRVNVSTERENNLFLKFVKEFYDRSSN